MKHKVPLIIPIVLIMVSTLVGCTHTKTPQAQEQREHGSALFDEGSRVCFVGDSITHGGGFHRNIRLYQMTRFPGERVSFYNCGVGGNQAHDVLARMEDDILIHDPTHAVIMLGMNDVHRDLYGEQLSSDPDILQKRREAISKYEKSMNALVELFLSKEIEVLVQKPTIYDQTAILEAKNNVGVNEALKACADLNEQIASKYDLPVIDYWSIMGRINEDIQREDPTSTIIGKDRVHPGPAGHLIMAYQFLKSMNAPRYVSKIVVDKDQGAMPDRSINCLVEPVSTAKPDRLSFRVTERALPFPTDESQREGMDLIPFTRELNNQLLQVSGLSRGKYKVEIDDVFVGEFSSQELGEGVNLAAYETTPQYCQAIKLLNKMQELWEIEGHLRDLKFIEYGSRYRNYTGDKNDVRAFCDHYLESLTESPYSHYHKYIINKYAEHKPRENEYRARSIRIIDEAYELAQPVTHSFKIEKL